MIPERAIFPFTTRRRSIAEIAFISVAVAALAVRAHEMPPSPLGFARIVFSVVAIAFVCFVPYQTLVRRAFVVLACEALFGTIAFALVDIPFVFEHQQQIGTFAVSIADDVDRFERGSRGR